MTGKPLISIILPTYNGEKYLATSLQSCLDQTFGDWELIVVDDCSQDSTPRIIADFAARDGRIRSLRNEPNKRLPASLNAGFAEARGELLTWTSDDNAYRPGALASMARHLDEHPTVGLVYCDYTTIDEAGKVTTAVKVDPPEELVRHCVVGACFMYRREVMMKVGAYDTAMFCAEDFDYWLRIAQHYPIARMQEDHYLYRLHRSSLTTTQRERMLRGTAKALAKNLPYIRFVPRRKMAQGYLTLASLANQHRDRMAALRYLWRASIFSPSAVVSRLLAGRRRRALREQA
jgi:glycosyltransferase involved in cell wall biosynthesis